MASILDKYGIKEVADITFYHIGDNGAPDYPVLYIDTAKTSTIEQTADEATANGGKGNVALISWDYNKDITVTLEDALFSAKSMAIMFGDGTVRKISDETGAITPLIMKTEQFTATANAATIADLYGTAGNDSKYPGGKGWDPYFAGPDGYDYVKLNAKFYDEEGKAISTFVKDSKYFCSFDLKVEGSVIRISADSFPGTYYVVGDTWARPQAGGDDEFFQFIIPKAKITSENTITLEADGDPSVFNMNLHVLRPESGDMMMLVKYDLVGNKGATTGSDVNIYHNHVLNKNDNSTATVAASLAEAGTGTASTSSETVTTNYKSTSSDS